MTRYLITHSDHDSLRGLAEGETASDAVADALERARWKDDGKWTAREVTVDEAEAETEKLAEELCEMAIQESLSESGRFDAGGFSEYFLENWKFNPAAVDRAWDMYEGWNS